MPSALDTTDEKWDGTTAVGSSPSDIHSRSDSTEKPSLLSCLPWGTHDGYRKRGPLSQGLHDRAAASNNGGDAPLDDGWPRLARKMTETLEYESFRRFRELNVKNLLYYQVEIAEMEAELRKVEREDLENGPREWTGKYARDAHLMLNAKEETQTDGMEKRQCELFFKIRKHLGEYSKMKRPQHF